ncbi:hypothetical protein A3D11_00255 [Candidatus Peribacteria bacterium RIFCSPHIGHO2_02_FULL_49_16]|nr:MAG: hypothetical protein A2880_02675 [Candidatus Peribacteria bacterium RIFCSPHIGHO2_01_FULL_49_38]OGJ59043.1 MAG: hypothetical protein A3D11_00255 [Candidatus Peribacteria bacterium RIFCSPHIGHO2_02_FULL_49_16]
MKRIALLSCLIIALFSFALFSFSQTALGQNPADVIDEIGKGKLYDIKCTGAECLIKLVTELIAKLRWIVSVVATLVLVRYGVRLVNSQDDEKLANAKKIIAGTITALMLTYLVNPLTDAFYGGLNEKAGKAIQGAKGAAILVTEVSGILDWFTFIIGILAVVTILVSGIVSVTSYGKEEGLVQLKRTVFAVIFGVILIGSKQVILQTFGIQLGKIPVGPKTAPVIDKALSIVNGLIVFSAAVAAAFIIFAGITMILNFGNAEQASKAKNILIKSIIGLMIMMTSFAIMRFVIGVF